MVRAALVVGSGTFNIEMPDMTYDVYECVTPEWAGVTISVSQGSAQVESINSGVPTILGTVGANSACIFEGEYSHVRVRARGGPCMGLVSNRRPTDGTGPDRTVGIGSVTLSEKPVRIFVRTNGATRHLTVDSSATSSQAWAFSVRSSHTGDDLVKVLEGNSTFVACSGVTELWLVGTGPVTFEVLDGAIMATAKNPPDVTVPKYGKKKDGEAVNSTEVIIHTNTTGTQCFSVEIENKGTHALVMHIENAKGEAQTPFILLKGNTTTISCANKRIWLTSPGQTGAADYEVKAVTSRSD